MASPCRQKGFFFFWVMMTQFTIPMISSPKAVTPTIRPIGREMFPVLRPSAGRLGNIGGWTAVLGAVLGPGVDSTRWDLVDTGWVMRGEPGATLGVGSTDAQTASILALPGMATELQLRWGLQVSVDDVVSENVPGAQGAHTTSDIGVAGVATPEPGEHLLSGMHWRHPSCHFSVQYQPGLHVQMRFCFRVQA